MKLLILADDTDICLPRFEEEAELMGLLYKRYFYEELLMMSNPIPKLDVDENTVLLARYPYSCLSNRNNEALLRIVLEQYRFSKIYDGSVYQTSWQQYEDKLYQTYVFSQLNIPYAELVDRVGVSESKFPLIVKKRFGSSGKGNFVVYSGKELSSFLENVSDPSKVIVQKFYRLKADYRVLMLGGDIVGVVERSVSFKKDNRVAVKTKGVASVPDSVLEMCCKVNDWVGADLIGVDVGQREDGSYMIIEYNNSPFFLGFERVTKLNVARRVIEYLMEGK